MNKIQMAEITLSEKEIDAAIRVLRSGALRQGTECDAFEKEFAEKTGAKFAVTSANGSAALHLAYMAFLKPGEEVLVPGFTFIATASMVSMTGGKPVLCDVDPGTFLIDLNDAEMKITEKTRAIGPVHLFGNPCAREEILSFAKKYRLKVVWDAAQAHGASINALDVGAWDDMVCYSFYPSKNMFVGEGGMTCTNDEELAHKMRFLRSHGQTGKYYHTMMGLNYRMTDVEAAIGREQLKRLDDMLAVRARNAEILTKGLDRIEGIRPQKITTESRHAWHQYCVVVEKDRFGCDRSELAAKLNDKGISTGVHYPRGLHQQPVFEELYGKSSLPNTEYLSENILALPVHHGLSIEDVDRIVSAFESCR